MLTDQQMTELKGQKEAAEEKAVELQANMELTASKVDEFEQELLSYKNEKSGGDTDKKPRLAKKVPKKPLKFQGPAKQARVDVSTVSPALSEDTTVLTNELITLGRDVAKLKGELRSS